jgi:hypothetical protein
MKKLMLSALALGAMTAVAMAGEPVQLTSSQLDAVSAGNPCSVNFSRVGFSGARCIQANWTNQVAAAVGGGPFSATVASNNNNTNQVQGDRNRTRIRN